MNEDSSIVRFRQPDTIDDLLTAFTLYEHISHAWTKEPQRFNLNPLHQMPGLNI